MRYHGRDLTILYDRTGQKYGLDKGLRLTCDGREIAVTEPVSRIEVELPTCTASIHEEPN